MTEKRYDAIIIGAGHNGMALATYLGKSGWKVLVLERRLEEGGGLCTEQYTRVGFNHNLHSNYHTFVGLCPVYDDLELVGGRDGVHYAHPPVQMGSIFQDGTAMTIHRDMKKTYASMSRFSKKDADTFQRLYKEVKGFQDLMIRTLMYAPPIDVNDITKALSIWKVEDKTEFFRARLRSMSINDFLDKHFEHDKVKAMLAFHASVCGYFTDVVGLAISFPFMLGKIDNWKLCIGGSHRLAHTLWRKMRRHDVTLRMASPVRKILVENGKAVGVKTYDDQEFYADKLVASSVDLGQTFNEMLGEEAAIPEKIQSGIDNYQYQDGSFFSVHMAMDKLPTYKAAAFDPDINNAWVLNVGFECLEDFNQDWEDIRNKKLPPVPKLNVAINSMFDPTDAPEGKATGLIRVWSPYDIDGKGPGEWDAQKGRYTKLCLLKMEQYCDNFTLEDVIQAKPYTPLDISEKLVNMVKGDWMVGKISEENLMSNRPSPLMSQYKTPVEGLYLCGSTTHPHGYITFGPAYNALKIIAEDFGMDRWWEEI